MKFSEAWLREYVDPDLTTAELVEQLTMAGLEVDGVEPVAAVLDKVVVGEILAVDKHPDADKLLVCRVSGGARQHQVVCGARNARAGLKAPFALVGATLPGLKVGKARLRGVESRGMLCSEKELGLGDNHEGLMTLPPDAPVGEALVDYLGLNDAIIDLDLTPNRSDCLSMVGLAREVGLLNGLDVNAPAPDAVAPVLDETFPVALAAGEACPRFVGRVIRNIDRKAPSPLWLKEKLRRAGLRAIDPVVDVTNFVMLELGQPLHAYDHAKLSGSIRVRQSAAGEKLTLLDGTAIETVENTLLITDESGPIGLAGIMGGLGTSVAADTRDIYLEGAFFAPAAIAGRARLYGLNSDAAHRFERGVDWQGQVHAVERATALLIAIAGGEAGPVSETTDLDALPASKTVQLRASRIARLLGVDIDNDRVDEILAGLGFQARVSGDKQGRVWEVSAPSHRFDIAMEADLIEEISRVYGYNKLPACLPLAGLDMPQRPEKVLSLDRIRDQMVSRGYFEAITYSFVDAKLQNLLDPGNEPVGLANPLSADMSVMRTTICQGLLKSLVYNANRQQERVRLFETGLCFSRAPNRADLRLDDIAQVRKLAAVACGPRQDESWANDPQPVDFYDVKGDLESILALTGEPGEFVFTAGAHPALHPGQAAVIRKNDAVAGFLGLLNPAILEALAVRFPIFLFEIEIDPIIAGKIARSEPLSRFPEVRRDISVIVDRAVTAAALRLCIRSAADDTLRDLKLFDVYQGKGIDTNRKSVALGLTFRHASRTLTDGEIDHAMDAVIASLEAELGASLRN